MGHGGDTLFSHNFPNNKDSFFIKFKNLPRIFFYYICRWESFFIIILRKLKSPLRVFPRVGWLGGTVQGLGLVSLRARII